MIPQARVVWAGLEFRRAMMLRNVEPLGRQQMMWTPPGHNCIAWQLWHIAEVEDNWVARCQLGRDFQFPFGLKLREAKPEQYPHKQQLLDYFAGVREESRRRLEAMDDADFECTFTDPDFGQLSVRDLWAGVVTSFAWHSGQIALLAKLLPDTPVKTMTFDHW